MPFIATWEFDTRVAFADMDDSPTKAPSNKGVSHVNAREENDQGAALPPLAISSLRLFVLPTIRYPLILCLCRSSSPSNSPTGQCSVGWRRRLRRF